jgi:hypothetical protein
MADPDPDETPDDPTESEPKAPPDPQYGGMTAEKAEAIQKQRFG